MLLDVSLVGTEGTTFSKRLQRDVLVYILAIDLLDDFSLLLFTLKLFSSLFLTIFSLKEKLSQKIRNQLSSS